MSSGTTFGELLRHLRQRAGLTQDALASMIGCSVSYISAVETGARRPDAEMVQTRIAPALARADNARLVARLVELAAVLDGRNTSTRAADSSPDAEHAIGRKPSSGGLFGRDADIKALSQQLMNHPGRLLTLTGAPGVGKTSLAQAVARVLAPFHADGAHTVWLGDVSGSELVGAAIATSLGSPEDFRPPEARLIDQLRHRELLLCLDNVDHVAHDSSLTVLVTELLKRCRGLRVLVTSRTRLKVRAEQRVQVQPLDSHSATDLFVARARSHRPDYTPSSAERDRIAELCRLLDNLPLAIELIAAHLAESTLPRLLEDARTDRLALLETRAPKHGSEQRTLTASLERSYALLTTAEQRALRMLSVLDGGAGLDGVVALGIDEPVLQALVDKSLVRLESQRDERRVRLLEVVREYAFSRLSAMGEYDDAQQRRLAWCLTLAEQAAPLLHSAEQTRWLHRLEGERHNLFMSLQYALDAGRLDAALQLVVALRHFWVARNYLAEITPWLDMIESKIVTTAIDPRLRARFLNCRGTVTFYRAQYDLAGAYFLEALELARAVGDRQEMAYALDGAGAQAVNCGDLERARAYSAASLEHSAAIGDHWLAGIALMNLGEIARMEGDITAASAHYRASLSRLQRSGDPYFIAIAEINLGQVYLLQRCHEQAEAVLRRALAAGMHAESARIVTSALEKLAGALCERDCVAAGRLFNLAQKIRLSSGVTVQPVDQADHAHLQSRLLQSATSEYAIPPVAMGLHLEWHAVHAAIEEIVASA